jgi:hypothetical protein
MNLIGRNAKIRVITEPQGVNLNSDQRPLVWAIILCAISWMKKDMVRMTVKAATDTVKLA